MTRSPGRRKPTLADPWIRCPVCRNNATVDTRTKTLVPHGSLMRSGSDKGKVCYRPNGEKPIPA